MVKSRGRVLTTCPRRATRLTAAREPRQHTERSAWPRQVQSRDASHARSDSELTSGSPVLLVVRRHLIQRGDRFARIPFMRGGA